MIGQSDLFLLGDYIYIILYNWLVELMKGSDHPKQFNDVLLFFVDYFTKF